MVGFFLSPRPLALTLKVLEKYREKDMLYDTPHM